MIHTAIILAGGFGTRLQSVIQNVPKPMAEVNGRPFLDYQLKYLSHHGIQNVVLSTGHLAHVIHDRYRETFAGLKLSYAEEKAPLGTGGGIRQGLEQCNSNDVLVLNGDSFFDIDLKDFVSRHGESYADFSIALRAIRSAGRYGSITLNTKNRIVQFAEKSEASSAGLINGGIYLFNREKFLAGTVPGKTFSVEKDFFEKQLDTFNIMGFEYSGYFIDIGIPEDYHKAQHDFKEFKY